MGQLDDFTVPFPTDDLQPPVQPAAPLANPFQDPVADMLGRLEASIEQPHSALDALYIDPVARALDQIEASVENQNPLWPSPASERLLSAFDDFEATNHPPVSLTPAGSLPSAGLHGALGVAGAGLTSGIRNDQPRSQHPMDAGQRISSASRQYPEHQYHVMGGSGAGIRNLGNDPDRYCGFREEWVSAEDCASCGDFEPAEKPTDGMGEGSCRHASTETDADDTHTDSDSERTRNDDE